MSRRQGQNPNVRIGKWANGEKYFYFQYWIDVPGEEARRRLSGSRHDLDRRQDGQRSACESKGSPVPVVDSHIAGRAFLRGDERIAFVMEPRPLLGLCADFKQLVGDVFNIVAPLRGHEAPEEIRHAAIWPLPFL